MHTAQFKLFVSSVIAPGLKLIISKTSATTQKLPEKTAYRDLVPMTSNRTTAVKEIRQCNFDNVDFIDMSCHYHCYRFNPVLLVCMTKVTAISREMLQKVWKCSNYEHVSDILQSL